MSGLTPLRASACPTFVKTGAITAAPSLRQRTTGTAGTAVKDQLDAPAPRPDTERHATQADRVGPMGSAKSLAAVERLKARLAEHFAGDAAVPEPPNYTDIKILRFYRGNKGNEDKAFEKLVRHAYFRLEDNVDNIGDNLALFAKELSARKMMVLDGTDKHGRPVALCYAHRHIASDRDLSQMRMLITYTLEALLKRAKPDEEKFVICFDLSKFTFACMDYECVKVLISVMRDNYPETLWTCLVMDAPMIFRASWHVIRPWLDPETVEKVAFIKRSQLGDYMDPSIIPATEK